MRLARALVLVPATLLAFIPVSATALADESSSSPSLTPAVSCVSTDHGVTSVAFGYTASASTSLPVGPSNSLTPAALDGAQPTSFSPGSHPASFSVKVPSNTSSITWTLVPRASDEDSTTSTTWTASGHYATCAATPLPAFGNGVVVAISGFLLAGVLALRTRRRTV